MPVERTADGAISTIPKQMIREIESMHIAFLGRLMNPSVKPYLISIDTRVRLSMGLFAGAPAGQDLSHWMRGRSCEEKYGPTGRAPVEQRRLIAYPVYRMPRGDARPPGASDGVPACGLEPG